ncbi:MAG: hypothetical protein ORN55_08135, partial [Chitinophagaceae bacterium]|nr:hypothetical protein [Chitinophagaceae bacterium]
MTILSGEYRNANTSTTTGATYIAGNLVNNGIFTNLGAVVLGSATTSSSTALSITASSQSQTISGTGIFQNLTTSSTANLSSLTVNNSNATGVTLAVPLSLSGTLTITAGKINTTATN